MRTHAFRGAGAAALTIGLVTTAFGSAQAAPDPSPGRFTTAPISGLARHRSELPALKAATAKDRAAKLALFARSAKNRSAAATSTGIIDMGGSFCPAGQVRDATYGHEGFETGLPFPATSDGFTVQTGAGAPDGANWANSTLAAADPAGVHWVETNYDTVPQTGKVYMSFSYRGQFVDGTVDVQINDDGGLLSPGAAWGTVALDITSQATTLGGPINVYFDHAAAPTAGSLDVDNVTIYSCKTPAPPAPNSGVRGDWTGQGTVDLLATRTDGSLWVYEGKGTGAFGSGVQVGSGWSAFTWQGSPGDVNGDGRTDMLARRSDGTLWFYPGKGNGLLGRGIQVGTGWNTMAPIATPGDFDLDGRPDLLARRSDGTLHLYSTLATGGLRHVRQLGAGWNIMRSIVGMGDLSGDKRGDLVAIRTDGVMFSYLSTGTGLSVGKQVSAGWNIMTLLTGPGDLNRDGRGDLISRRSDGTLWFYPGRLGGGVYSGKQVGSGWNIMSNIL